MEQESLTDIDPKRVRQLLQRMGEMVATFEVAEVKLRDREQQLESRINEHEHKVNNQMQSMRDMLQEFQMVMTEAGVARWRLAAEGSLEQGAKHVDVLKSTCEEFRQLSEQTCERLERATAYSVKGVTEAMDTIRVADFKQIAEESCNRVEFTATTAVKNIAKVARWFYWKKLVLVFVFSTAVAVIYGLYINAEWPWEMHQDILQQREVGTATMRAWPQLSRQDQEIIRHNSKRRVT